MLLLVYVVTVFPNSVAPGSTLLTANRLGDSLVDS